MNQYVFLVFLVVSAVVTAYIGLVVEETKNQTFQEISRKFERRNGVKVDLNEEEEMMPLKWSILKQTHRSSVVINIHFAERERTYNQIS